MSRSNIPAQPAKKAVAPASPVIKTTPARNSPVPKAETQRAAAPAARQISHEMIARRAFEISLGGQGDELSNWLAAERELKGS
jgi:hypothetical protein